MNAKPPSLARRGRRFLYVTVLSLAAAFWAGAHQGPPPPADWQAHTKALAAVPQLVLPPTDAQAELAASASAKGSGPLPFAVARPVLVTPATDGAWEAVEKGRLWRLRLLSTGATDLNLAFTRFWLPPGALLYLIAETEGYYQGPYTEADNTETGQLWTPVVPGPEAVIALFVPSDAIQEPALELTQVNTGFRNLFHLKDGSGVSLSKAGSCEIDVVCPQAEAWTNEIRSVARISIGGVAFCTATMVMNAAANFRNFLLTANHCGISTSNAASVVAYWNYQSPTCGRHGLGGSLAQNTSGATFRAAKYDVDFCLIELSRTPDAAYGVYYAGWDRRGLAPAGVVGIHHPNADGKCISFSSNTLTTVNSCIGTGGAGTHWNVVWSLAVTEPGSSGSAIWDPGSRAIVGTLSGGDSDCSNPAAPDCYGKFSIEWTLGSDAASRLRDWLDPSNSGVSVVTGSYPLAAPPAANDICAQAIPLVPGEIFSMYTTNATSTGDPTPTCRANAGKGVWFSYSPPVSGTVTLSTCGSDFDTVLAVYTGACAALTAVACNDDDGAACAGSRASVSFAGTAGTTYFILAAGYNGANGRLQILAALPNDNCAGAIPLLPQVPVTLSTTTATSANDAAIPCRPSSGAGVWFTFAPSVSAPILVTTCGSSFDTVLEVYSGTCGSLAPLACVDDGGPDCAGTYQGSLVFNGGAGTTYFIQAAGYLANTGTLQIVAQLVNDACAGALTLTPGVACIENTADATSANDPTPCANSLGKGVWFAFTATNSGVVAISTCGSDYDTALEVFDGTCGKLSLVTNGCNDDAGWACRGVRSSVAFPATVGTTYYVLAGGYNQAHGNLSVVADVVPARLLTVSTSPNSGLSIGNEPLDVHGSGNGSSGYTRTYPNGATVRLTAPATDGSNAFQKWQVDGLDYTNGLTAVIPMTAPHAAAAVYALPNDFCAGAIPLTNGVPVSFSNTSATGAGDPQVPCGSLDKGVWFKFTPAINELVTVTTGGGSLDTVLQVFTGACGALTRVPYGGNDDGGPASAGTNASVVFSGRAGTNYYILAGTHQGSAGGGFTIAASSGLVNDSCNGALPLAYGAPFTMTTLNATTAAGETPPCQAAFGKSVWFTFISPVTGPVPVSTCGSSFDTVLQVFTGTCAALTPVACADDNGPSCAGSNASLVFNAAAGTNYYILAGGWGGTAGNLSILAGSPPALSANRTGNLVQLAWPAWYWPAFVLQRLTNSAGIPLNGSWIDQFPNTLNPTWGASNAPAFYRLITP